MKKKTYVLISLLSVVCMIIILNISHQQEESFYYPSENMEEKEYFNEGETQYIESFFIECTVLNNEVSSLKNNNQKPLFVYKNQRCWIYFLTTNQYILKKEGTLYSINKKEVLKLSKGLKNLNMESIKNTE